MHTARVCGVVRPKRSSRVRVPKVSRALHKCIRNMLAQDPSEPLGFQTQPCNSKAVRGQVRSRRSPTNSGTATAGTQARGTTGRRDRALKRLKPTREARRRRSPWPPREMMSQPSGPPRDHLTQRSTTAPCPVSVALEQPGFQAPCPARPLSSAFLSPLSFVFVL